MCSRSCRLCRCVIGFGAAAACVKSWRSSWRGSGPCLVGGPFGMATPPRAGDRHTLSTAPPADEAAAPDASGMEAPPGAGDRHTLPTAPPADEAAVPEAAAACA